MNMTTIAPGISMAIAETKDTQMPTTQPTSHIKEITNDIDELENQAYRTARTPRKKSDIVQPHIGWIRNGRLTGRRGIVHRGGMIDQRQPPKAQSPSRQVLKQAPIGLSVKPQHGPIQGIRAQM